MIKADLLITNANILTLDIDNNYKGSLAVTNGRISGLWTETEPSYGTVDITEAEVLNAKGATIIPGFIDTHSHLLGYSMNKNQINCGTPPNKSMQDLLAQIRLKVQHTPEGEWIQGYGYDDTLLAEQRHPTREELDQVAPNHPVLLTHVSIHFGAANSKALELAGVTEEIVNPPGAYFGRDNHGRLNGVLYEAAALEYVTKVIPIQSANEIATLIGNGAMDYVAEGVTSTTDAAVGFSKDGTDLAAHVLAAKDCLNPMRTELMIMGHLLEEGGKFSNYSSEELAMEISRLSEGTVRLNSIKLFQDGSIQGQTGALRKPYYNDADVVGELLYDQQALNEKVFNLHKRGFRMATHGNGDKAIGSILTAYEHALKAIPRENHLHRIEHVQMATKEDIAKMRYLNVAGSVFINHVYYWGDRHKRLFLGPERAASISPLASMKEQDVLFTLHTDCPVTPISPLFSIWAAVNRLTEEGEVLGPDERIDVITALKAMTINGARLNFTEADSGSIEMGKYADFVLLNQDPTKIHPLEIKEIEVEATIIAGKIVYQK